MAFQSVIDGFNLLIDSVRFLFRKPVFLLPIFFSWALVSALVLFLRYYIFFPDDLGLAVLAVFGVVFLITMTVCMANIVMLEFMQQMESGEKISFSRAFGEALVDLPKVIPVALVWAVIWFIILVIKVLTSKKNDDSKPEPSPRDAALALGGADSGPFSWLKLGLRMFEKLVRMYIFLALPAIAWENMGPFSAFRRAIEVIRRHPMQFITAYTLTGIASLFMAVPLIIVFYLDKSGVAFSSLFWTGVIIYEGIVWTFGIYLEQMSVGLLYLWHMKWLKKGGKGDLSSVSKPDLLDNVYELS
ncbi:hypothetical protein HYU11_02855 [Candidatus Woesearchaeota archaeon]|nr:hypothetical protein [Candidatus Woesearchaeota archaeon]